MYYAPSGVLRVGGIGQIKEDETTQATAVTRLSSNNKGKVAVRVGEDVVHTSQRQVVPVRSQIGIGTERLRALLVVDVKQLD